MTIEGADSRMSLTKRTTSANALRLPYSARCVPARMPIGAPSSTATSNHHTAAVDSVEQSAIGARRRRHLRL